MHLGTKAKPKVKLKSLKKRKVRIITVGVGSLLEDTVNYLNDLASPKSSHMAKYKELKDSGNYIRDMICSPVVLPASKFLCYWMKRKKLQADVEENKISLTLIFKLRSGGILWFVIVYLGILFYIFLIF